jgi:hypothetical protein
MWSRVGKAVKPLKALDAVPITSREFYGFGIQELWKLNAETHKSSSNPLKIGRRALRDAMHWY